MFYYFGDMSIEFKLTAWESEFRHRVRPDARGGCARTPGSPQRPFPHAYQELVRIGIPFLPPHILINTESSLTSMDERGGSNCIGNARPFFANCPHRQVQSLRGRSQSTTQYVESAGTAKQ